MTDTADTSANIGSKLSQLLADVITQHAPFTAEVTGEARRRQTEAFLEGLETYSAELVTPFVEKALAAAEPYPAIKAYLQEHKAPSAAFGGIATQFLVFGVGFEIGSQIMTPYMAALSQMLWTNAVNEGVHQVLSPADIAAMVIRGIYPGSSPTTPLPDWGATAAAKSGIRPLDMQALVDVTGMPPDNTSLFEMIRRGIIDETRLREGMRQSDLRNEWIDAFTKLRYVTPSVTDMVRAAVQNQMTYEQAKTLAGELGLEPPGYVANNPDWFQLLYHTAGRPPGPETVARAAKRGIIGWDTLGPNQTTFAQAISESDIKDKWASVLKQVERWFPTPGEVKGLLVHGAITEAQAIDFWQRNGMDPNMSAAYMHTATFEQLTTDKALAKSDILQLIQEGLLSESQATTLLSRVGFTGAAATSLVAMARFRWSLVILRTAVQQVARLYTSRKIDATQAQNGLAALGLGADQISRIMGTLTIQRNNTTLVLTAAQVMDCWEYNLMTAAEARSHLQGLGYSPSDAWYLLSIKNRGPLPNPPPGVTLPGGTQANVYMNEAMVAVTEALSANLGTHATQVRTALSAAMHQLEVAVGYYYQQ